MSRRFRLTRLAEQDVCDLVLHVASSFGAERGERVRTELLTAFRLVAERPEIGRLRPELWKAPYRFWPLGSSPIAYRADGDPIQTVRVARASRDWPALSR